MSKFLRISLKVKVSKREGAHYIEEIDKRRDEGMGPQLSRLERTPDKREAGGSSPPRSTMNRKVHQKAP